MFIFLSTSKITSPPSPPSPPSGPPAATNNSRLKLTWPFPPLPDLTYIFALSANIFIFLYPCFIKKCPKSMHYKDLGPIISYYSATATGYTETCFLSLPNLSNLTFPSTVANNVSSLPIPTFVPGWI